jgi:hypothetical protein
LVPEYCFFVGCCYCVDRVFSSDQVLAAVDHLDEVSVLGGGVFFAHWITLVLGLVGLL